MAFEEPGSVAYLYEGDKKIAQIKVDTTVVLKNLKTGKEYDSDAEGDADVDHPDTDTKREDISRSVYIKVAKMPAVGAESQLQFMAKNSKFNKSHISSLGALHQHNIGI